MTCQGFSCPYYRLDRIPTDRGYKPEWMCIMEERNQDCPYESEEEDEQEDILSE